jgi:hypothetical protein
MPLFPVSTYSSWQLACIAALEPLDPTHAEHAQSNQEICAELRTRQIADADIGEMIALARRIGKRTSPIVCMDIDDLQLGIAAQFDAAEIDAAERDRLLSFVAAHIDCPREQTQFNTAKRRAHWVETFVVAYVVIGFALVALSHSGRGFFVWLAGMFAVIWLQQSWSSSRLRRWRPKGR